MPSDRVDRGKHGVWLMYANGKPAIKLQDQEPIMVLQLGDHPLDGVAFTVDRWMLLALRDWVLDRLDESDDELRRAKARD